MRRLVPLLALCLLLALPAPARAMDAQKVFRESEEAVLIIYLMSSLGKVIRQGSGFVVGDGRLAVTNHHVVKGASSVTIKTADGHVHKGVQVVGRSSERDLAVLRLPYKMPSLELAEDLPVIGQEVVAIGSPMGLERTLSTGVVSGLGREMLEKKGLIQITTPVSPGSSGGPVLDAGGKVVGVATIASVSGAVQNINFAVPATEVRKLLGFPPASDGAASPASGGLDVRTSPDGSITIIQKRSGQ